MVKYQEKDADSTTGGSSYEKIRVYDGRSGRGAVFRKMERYIEKLNEYGRQGWRLISGTDDWKYSVFEREIEDAEK